MSDIESLKNIKGIGEKTAKLFNELGVYDIDDLVHFFPVKYQPYERMISIEEAGEEEQAAICARLVKTPKTVRAGKLKITNAVIEDYSGKIRCVWYNSPYIASGLEPEKDYVFAGKINRKGHSAVLEHPVIYKAEDYRLMAGRMRPLYRTVKGLSQKLIIKAITSALENYSFEEDYLPVDIREKYGFMDNDLACRRMHFSEDRAELESARRRIVFDEFFNFIYSISRLKGRPEEKSVYKIKTEGIYEEFTSMLPFTFTDDQRKAVNDIFEDINKGKTVNRLIQGDVGSGKTVVSLTVMYAAYKSGHQSVIMVPTEVLANQHFRTCEKIFSGFKDRPVIGLLTGSMSAKEKRELHRRISDGEIDIIIGTHALIQDDVSFADAAVVVTDEQHRFGVRQREKLTEYEKRPHVLVMSATPIPRTLAVILYGDLDISAIVSKPEGRLPVKNAVIKPGDRGKAYRTILNEVGKGHQAYIICPMVEESEAIDAENVIDYTSKIKSIFPENIVVQFLHGRMSQNEKDNIMCSFVNGDINILISTTVVEVGVDVPNATVMMIENAERFGLASLHQLRGRVGRGSDQAYCIFVLTSGSENARKRLEVVGSSNDGFHIAAEDLKLRGPGELLGHAQSGDMHFNVADVYSDSELLQTAQECCEYIDTEEFRPDDDELIRFMTHMERYRDKRLTNLSI